MAAEKQVGKVRITLIKGLRGKKDDHRATVRGLGLRWRSHTVELDDTPEVRGMIGKIAYMLRVSQGSGRQD